MTLAPPSIRLNSPRREFMVRHAPDSDLVRATQKDYDVEQDWLVLQSSRAPRKILIVQ